MKKGISLIVLSITILVMAILAATAIIALEDSGIIGRSKNTVSKQNQQEEYTRLQVIKNGILTDNLGEITVDEYITELKSQGMIENDVTTNEYGNKVVTTKSGIEVYIHQNGESDLTISFEKITANVTTLGSLITSAADYGKIINYEANGVTDWKVFYEDETNGYVYLIASEALEYDKLPSKLTNTVANGGAGALTSSKTITLSDGTARETGIIYWYSSTPPSKQATIQHPEMWMANWSDYSAYPNARCASYFLDETLWGEFKNSTASYATYIEGVVGTPTPELFIASWNAKREATNDIETYNIKLSLSVNGTKGYYVNNAETNSSAIYQNITTTDPLYVWTTAEGAYIWLAAPSANHTSNLIHVEYDGNIGDEGFCLYYSTYFGVRPVVCLNSNVPAQVGTGDYDYELIK